MKKTPSIPLPSVLINEQARLERFEEAVKTNEALLRLFIKHTPAAIAMFDTDMHYLQVSDRFLTDYDLEGQDLIGKSHYEVFPTFPIAGRKFTNESSRAQSNDAKKIHTSPRTAAPDGCNGRVFPGAKVTAKLAA